MKKKRKTDKQVLKELFPPEIVREVDETLKELDSKTVTRENPAGKRLKPWGKKWVKTRGSK